MKLIESTMVVVMFLAAILMAGCVSNAPVKETSNSSVPSVPNAEMKTTDRFVELQMIDGTKVGGKYLSESAAFVTIIPMYVIDKYGDMDVGNGESTGIKTALVNTMKDIDNPSAKINATLEAKRIKAEEEQKLQQAKALQYAEEAKKRDAEIAARMPTKKGSS